ncbi:hypothetical protein Dimus_026800 [Dionaea muscipula]
MSESTRRQAREYLELGKSTRHQTKARHVGPGEMTLGVVYVQKRASALDNRWEHSAPSERALSVVREDNRLRIIEESDETTDTR